MRGEARFLKGLMQEKHYKSVWMFSLAYCAALFYLWAGSIGLTMTIAAMMRANEHQILGVLVGGTLPLVVSGLLLVAGAKIFVRLTNIFRKKETGFQIRVIPVLGIIIFISIIGLVLFFNAIGSTQIIF